MVWYGRLLRMEDSGFATGRTLLPNIFILKQLIKCMDVVATAFTLNREIRSSNCKEIHVETSFADTFSFKNSYFGNTSMSRIAK